MKKLVRGCVVSVALLIALPAAAQQAGGGSDDPCQKDAAKLCKDDVPDEAKIAACLKANQAKVSAACRKSFDARAKAKGM